MKIKIGDTYFDTNDILTVDTNGVNEIRIKTKYDSYIYNTNSVNNSGLYKYKISQEQFDAVIDFLGNIYTNVTHKTIM